MTEISGAAERGPEEMRAGDEADTHAENESGPREEAGTERPAASGGNAREAIPEEYCHLLGERPLLWYEDEAEFDEFENAVFAELAPKGMVECIYVRDWVECEWELRRTKRLARAAIYSSLATFASDELAEAKGGLAQRMAHQDVMRNCARGSAMGISAAMNTLNGRAKELHLRPVDLHLAAHRDALQLTEAISREAVRLERRRDQVLVLLEERRASLAVMARCLIKRSDAEVLDLEARTA